MLMSNKEPVMTVLDVFPRPRRFVPFAMAALLAIGVAGNFPIAKAQGSPNIGAKKADPAKSFRVPPLPVGSAHVQLQPGMSKKDWHDAYKETGRPKFPANTVKRVGGTVERD